MAWSDLTIRQQELDRAIDRSGVKLNSSNGCLRKVMRAIGAKESEAAFVQNRIALRLRTQFLLDETDNFINRTEKMLDDFEKDDKEWERKGRALGRLLTRLSILLVVVMYLRKQYLVKCCVKARTFRKT